jgi:putative membrane protein
MWWSDYWPMPGIFFGPIMMIAFVITCMALMFFLMRGGMMHGNRRQDPIDILKERFARGEIGQAEYEERRRLLQA